MFGLKNKPRAEAVWDNSRWIELERLETLLAEVNAINKGSDCLGRIARCIELADLLNRTEFGARRSSFKHFLRELALADRFGE